MAMHSAVRSNAQHCGGRQIHLRACTTLSHAMTTPGRLHQIAREFEQTRESTTPRLTAWDLDDADSTSITRAAYVRESHDASTSNLTSHRHPCRFHGASTLYCLSVQVDVQDLRLDLRPSSMHILSCLKLESRSTEGRCCC